jgi:HK97 family phage major capsid protein
MATYAEQIGAFENKRAANIAAMSALMKKSEDEGSTFDATQQEEFDGHMADNEAIDAHLKRLRVMEKANIATVAPVNGDNAEHGAQSRLTSVQRSAIILKKELPKGTMFARYVGALANARGNRFEAAEFAKRWADSTPEVEAMLRMPTDLIEKTAVNPGTTTDSTWAAPLVQYTNMASEFIDYLRPLTIMGRMDGFRRVPFKVKVPRQTGGASVNWVGEGKVKPLSALAFDSLTLDFAKVAGIVPLTEELVRFSSPAAEELVRADLASAIAQFLDAEFIDPSNAATDVSPASVTYGVSAITASGTTAAAFRLDVKEMFAALLTANQQVSSGYWIMTQGQALAFSLMMNALGQPEFPGITMNGGTLLGFPVITTQNLSASTGSPADGYPISFVMPSEILLADDGGVTIDMSREASLQMETTPDSPWTASTVTVNLWQHNMIAIKAERYINWKPRRATAAGVIAGAHYAE